MIEGIEVIEEFPDYKVVLPEWAYIAGGIALLVCILFIGIAMLCDLTNHDATVPLWFSTVFLVVAILLLIVGGVLHEVVPDEVYWEVEIDKGKVDALEFQFRYDSWIEVDADGVEHYYIKEKKPG